jgi:hypothetical protein
VGNPSTQKLQPSTTIAAFARSMRMRQTIGISAGDDRGAVRDGGTETVSDAAPVPFSASPITIVRARPRASA